MKARPALSRWLVFNGVGVIGFGVQIATLAVLVHLLEMHYLVATLMAVETAVLHNFFWHRRWTWCDRRGAGFREALGQLVRFHLANGLVSMIGNLLMMFALTGGFGWSPVPANVLTVLACSAANFLASDRLVFRTATVAVIAVLFASSSTAPVSASGADTAEPAQATLNAWNQYEKLVDARYAEPDATRVFFAHDEFQQDSRWRPTALSGAIAMFQATTPRRGLPEPAVPGGRVHHWVGAVYVPGATVESVLRHLKEHAGREADAYDDVLASRLIERNADKLRVFMKLRRESVITVTYNTEHQVEYRRLQAGRASSRSVATRIAELADAGGAGEHEKAAGQDHGFLWRLNAYWRYEQVPGGVLIECESVSLSRSVPVFLKLLINRTVDRIARESLEKTLRSLRTALLSAGRNASA